jgi:uncharacterized protein (DUF1015 family)
MDSPGMVVLPTHRVLAGLPAFDPGGLLGRAGEYYEVTEAPDGESLVRMLRESGARAPSVGMAVQGSRKWLLRLREGSDAPALIPDAPPGQASLEVVLLHRLILERCLGLTEDSIRRESYIRYVRDGGAAMAEVEEGRADVCFLLNPTPLGAVRDIAFSGEVLPQKSTDFFPKLLSGLAMYSGD